MTLRRPMLLLVLLVAPCAAQHDYREVTRLLDAGRFQEAAAKLVRLIDAQASQERTAALDRAYLDFRGRGASASWLAALDGAVASRPADVELLRFRAYTRIDLKLLAGGREDLHRALKIAPRDDRLRRSLGWAAALAFEHADAARHFQGIEPAAAARHADIVSSLDDARGRQTAGLVIGLAIVSVLAVAILRFTSRAAAA